MPDIPKTEQGEILSHEQIRVQVTESTTESQNKDISTAVSDTDNKVKPSSESTMEVKNKPDVDSQQVTTGCDLEKTDVKTDSVTVEEKLMQEQCLSGPESGDNRHDCHVEPAPKVQKESDI